jgi:hypothetical protein
MWWIRPSVAKTFQEAIQNDMTAKMLMKETHSIICCMQLCPILLEECFLELNTHTLKKQDEGPAYDILLLCIGEEKWPNNFYCRNRATFCASFGI